MSCDFELKMVVSYINRRLMYDESNRKKGVKTKKIDFLQDGCLGFSKYLDFDTQNFKKQVFSGKSALNPKFSKFSKNRIICIVHT